jgi:hypothetical protein
MIITPYEVIKYGPVQKDYPTSIICDYIDVVEEELFDDCALGNLFTVLQADLKPVNVNRYNPSTIYALADRVNLDGEVYISLKAANTVNPLDSLPSDPSWSIDSKFNDELNNKVFKRYVGPWLSLHIIHRTIRYETYKASSQGILKITPKFSESGITTVDNGEFISFKKELMVDAEAIYKRMIKYVKANYSVPDTTEDCIEFVGCKPKSKISRRFIFKY